MKLSVGVPAETGDRRRNDASKWQFVCESRSDTAVIVERRLRYIAFPPLISANAAATCYLLVMLRRRARSTPRYPTRRAGVVERSIHADVRTRAAASSRRPAGPYRAGPRCPAHRTKPKDATDIRRTSSDRRGIPCPRTVQHRRRARTESICSPSLIHLHLSSRPWKRFGLSWGLCVCVCVCVCVTLGRCGL